MVKHGKNNGKNRNVNLDESCLSKDDSSKTGLSRRITSSKRDQEKSIESQRLKS